MASHFKKTQFNIETEKNVSKRFYCLWIFTRDFKGIYFIFDRKDDCFKQVNILRNNYVKMIDEYLDVENSWKEVITEFIFAFFL